MLAAAMNPQQATELAVRRELLRLALQNSSRSVPLQLVAVGIMVALGLNVGATFAATAVAALGVAVAIWRYTLKARYPQSAELSELRISKATTELEGNS